MRQKSSSNNKTTIRIDQDIHDKIKALAAIRKCLLEQVANEALDKYFEEHKGELVK